MKIKNYIITMLLAAGLITSLSACVNDGGQVFGELPPGVSLVSGEVPEARSASYDELLHELRITWKTPIDRDRSYISNIERSHEDRENVCESEFPDNV